MARKNKIANVEVEIVMTGGEAKTYVFDHEPTVTESLERAGLDAADSSTVRVNGDEAEGEDTLENGDILTITSKVKGG